MSRSKASRTRARDAKHVRLYLYMLKSEAWRSLSCPARCLLIVLQAHYDGTNNGELFLSVRDAAKALGTSLKQASAAFRELEDRGFIRATRKGSRTRRGEVRMATCWRLTEYDDDLTGRQPSKEFMTWKPPEPTVSARTERARKANAIRWRKISTVSHKDTHRIPQGYGSPSPTPKNGPDRIPQGYAQADFEGPTVSHKDTQLVNHVGEPEKAKQKGRAAISRQSPRKPQTTYGGKPTLKLRTLDLLRANGVCRRADIIQTLACHPVEAGRVLRELIATGMAERVRHGVYRAVGRALTPPRAAPRRAEL